MQCQCDMSGVRVKCQVCVNCQCQCVCAMSGVCVPGPGKLASVGGYPKELTLPKMRISPAESCDDDTPFVSILESLSSYYDSLITSHIIL